MKKKRKLLIAGLILALTFTFVGCTNTQINSDIEDIKPSQENNVTGTMTLKEFLDSGPKVGFPKIEAELDKSSTASSAYLFEDGKVYLVDPKNNAQNRSDDVSLTYGDISKMTDDEIIEWARNNKTDKISDNRVTKRFIIDKNDPALVENGGSFDLGDHHGEIEEGYTAYGWVKNGTIVYDGYLDGVDGQLFVNADGQIFIEDDNDELIEYDGRYGELTAPKSVYEEYDYIFFETGDYELQLYSDNTGNNVERETLNATVSDGITFLMNFTKTATKKQDVYDSTFLFVPCDVMPTELAVNYLAFRINGDLTITFDSVDNSDIEIAR